MTINEIMSKNIIVGNIKNSIYELAVLMKNNNIGFLPIVDKNRVVGVITDRDIVIKAISNSTNTSNNIENYITKKIIYLDQNKNINDCLNLMSKYKVKRIIITDDKKMTGIISLSDILNSKLDKDLIINTLKDIYPIFIFDENYKNDTYYI